MKTIKGTFLTRTRWILSSSLILLAVLLIGYGAVADAPQAGAHDASSVADASRTADDRDPEYMEKRREWIERFFGTGQEGVSASDYAAALAAARALPQSPLLQNRTFMPATQAWSFPIPPPIQGDGGGDGSAKIQTLAIDPTNANVVYTGSLGGLAKTNDGGVTWQYLSDAWSSQSVSSIAVDPNAHNYVYVGTGKDSYGLLYNLGIFRSFDGGASWAGPLGGTQLAKSYIRTVAIDPNNSGSQLHTTLYIANGPQFGYSGTPGLWRSTDSGSNFALVPPPGGNNPPNGIYDVAIDASTNPSTLYVTEDDGVFKSTSPGGNWTPIAPNGLSGTSNKLSVVNSTVYLLRPGDAQNNFYKSTDRGATWTQILEPCPMGGDTCADSGHIGFAMFAVDPANSQIILGGNPALYRTTNGGGAWTEIGTRYGPDLHTDQNVAALSPTAPNTVYVGNDGGISDSTDAGQHWANLNHNFPGALMYSVALGRDDSMIGGTQDHGTVFSRLGSQWFSFADGDGAHDLIDPIDNTYAYKCTYIVHPNQDVAGAFKRFNRTPPYQPTSIAPMQLANDSACQWFPAFSMNQSSPTHLIAACQHVARTVNATASLPTWTTIGATPDPSPGAIITAASEAPNNSDVIYAISDLAKVWVTTNANSQNPTWSNGDPNHNLPGGGLFAITVDPILPQTAYVACDAGVYKTTDGATWTPTSTTPSLYYRDVAIDPANTQHIFAASLGGVFSSTNGGGAWAPMSVGIPVGMAVTSLSFNATTRQLAASTYGRGAYVLDLDDVPPTVTITAPPNGATVSGTVTVSANAADNHRVVGVQFKLNGTNLGNEVTSPPYSIQWITSITDCGSKTLTAVARDPAGNTRTSTPVTVTVNGPCKTF